MQYLREEISRIDESWAAARFDSLPHVVHILTSKDREGEVQFLKEQSEIIEEVVDEVVHAYHSGFNKAIQNYSQVSEDFLLDCYNYTYFSEFSSSYARMCAPMCVGCPPRRGWGGGELLFIWGTIFYKQIEYWSITIFIYLFVNLAARSFAKLLSYIGPPPLKPPLAPLGNEVRVVVTF